MAGVESPRSHIACAVLFLLHELYFHITPSHQVNTLFVCDYYCKNVAFPLLYSYSIPSSALRDFQELCYLTLIPLCI